MSYIVATANIPDERFETYDEACAWARFMRREGVEALVVARGITGDYNLDTVQCH